MAPYPGTRVVYRRDVFRWFVAIPAEVKFIVYTRSGVLCFVNNYLLSLRNTELHLHVHSPMEYRFSSVQQTNICCPAEMWFYGNVRMFCRYSARIHIVIHTLERIYLYYVHSWNPFACLVPGEAMAPGFPRLTQLVANLARRRPFDEHACRGASLIEK